MRTSLIGALAVAGLVGAAGLSGSVPREPAQPPGLARSAAVPSFSLGVLRRDGVVIPIVSFGSGGWINRWPAPGRRVDIPISVEDSPRGWWRDRRPIADWTAWPLGGESRPIRVTSLTNLVVECEPQVALKTDYRSANRPESPKIQPYPKDGLATSGEVRIEAVRLLDVSSPEWTAIAGTVGAKLTAAEPGAFKEAQLKRPVPDAVRSGTPFTLEVLYATPGVAPGTSVLYFEGIKRYPGKETVPRGLMTYAVGFAMLGFKGSPDVLVSATLTDARRQGLVYTMPLGSFRMGDRLFWIVQRSAWGYERFDVVEIRGEEILTIFKTPGGVCD